MSYADKREEELTKKFPNILGKTIRRYGMSVGEGWLPIIERTCEKLSELDLTEDFEAVQIKEKFGGLRFYTSYSTEEIHKIIDEAEEEALRTCEVCGENGEDKVCRRHGGWIKTLCDSCHEKREKERAQ